MTTPEPTPTPEVQRLGRELHLRRAEVVRLAMLRSRDSGVDLGRAVEQRFEQIGDSSTTAVANWMAGQSPQAAIEAGQEIWQIFGTLAAQRSAPLNEVTKRCWRWRDAAGQVLGDTAAELDCPAGALQEAIGMLDATLRSTIVAVCECFDAERNSSDQELAERQQELTFMATHDPLTHLPNRTLIVDRLQQMLLRAKRTSTPVAALFIDLDNFKTINDTLGHAAGDELLRAVAARLDGVVRDVDALGRIGGDEFVVIAGDLSAMVGPDLIAERLLDTLRAPIPLGEDRTPVTVSASIGIATGEGCTADDLLRDADIAMYRAKWGGPGRYVVFRADMAAALQSRMELELELRAALRNDEFMLAFQPTFSLTDMSPTGLEALIRWHSPSRGVVQPNEFIPILEETGLIVEVGAWVIERACDQAARWRLDGHRVGIAVNVSARQLDADRIIDDVRRALADSGLDAPALTLEITESTLMRDAEATVRRLKEIKQLGVRVAIDDFGTGYSSLAHLRQFPVDALKIDRSFITGLAQNLQGESLIRTLVQLGKALSIETIAEGIEQQSELSLLREESCDAGQGFLFARPLDAAGAEEFLREHATSQSAALHVSRYPMP